MTIYVFESENCKKDAEKHGQTLIIKNIKSSIERNQHLVGFGSFSDVLIKKPLGKSFRLICYKIQLDENDDLILFSRIFARSSSEYESLISDAKKDPSYVHKKFQPYTQDEIKKIHEELIKKPPVDLPRKPNNEEYSWLYEVMQKQNTENDLFVLETEDWVKKVKLPENQTLLGQLFQTIYNVKIEKLKKSDTNKDCNEYWSDVYKCGFIYLYRCDYNRLVFLEPFFSRNESNLLSTKYKDKFYNMHEESSELIRIAARSYPILMTLDRNAWLAIQQDESANLALSPEEAELLDSIQQSEMKSDLGYPLFINGRAGSGKSTMLQYFAAYYVDFALQKNTTALPLYMTCSRELLERARDTVTKILTIHHTKLLETVQDKEKIDFTVKSSFKIFHEFLYSLLSSKLKENFNKEKYVNYAKFHFLWSNDFEKRQEARQLSVDISWHAIRSYIKGVRSRDGGELTPDDFNLLARGRRSISESMYKKIYEQVWCSWYKRLCDDDGYWDDQDLASFILDEDLASHHNYAAIFCDEAQDFTSIELDIIFQLSLFSRRSLQPEELRRVPFIFAGDPLQTINPTGFSWDSVQANFHDQFCAILDPKRQGSIKLSYRELQFNYRSNPGIVGFCNLIQLVRTTLLGAKNVRPQKAWYVDDPVQTVYFDIDNPQTNKNLRENEKIIKIINCEDGEETNYMKTQSSFQISEIGTEKIYHNILGPTRAKGLEFPVVVLYRFGETAPEKFSHILDNNFSLDGNEDRLPFEYFLNRLYVAISRAKGQLIIIESKRVISDFWKFATDHEIITQLKNRVVGDEEWKHANIGYLVPGENDAWRGKQIDLQEQTKEFETQGILAQNPFYLKQAALGYQSIKDEDAAKKCIALAYEIEEKYQDAGKQFRDIGLHNDAFRCYWLGREWKLLSTLAKQETHLNQRLESRVVEFMISKDKIDPKFLKILISAVKNKTLLQDKDTVPTWNHVLCEIAKFFAKKSTENSISWLDIYFMFVQLKEENLSISDEHLATIAYAAREYSAVVQLWDRIGNTDHSEYFRAKAQITSFPEKLIIMKKIKGENKKIIDTWQKEKIESADLKKFNDDVLWTVAEAAVDVGDLILAKSLLRERPHKEIVFKLIDKALITNESDIVIFTTMILVQLLIKNSDWASIILLIDFDLPNFIENKNNKLKAFFQEKDHARFIHVSILQEIARAENLLHAEPKDQKQLYKFIQKKFIGEEKNNSVIDNSDISFQEIGSAIERVGENDNIKNYYINIINISKINNISNEIEIFAIERFVRILENENGANISNTPDRHESQLSQQISRRHGTHKFDIKNKNQPPINEKTNKIRTDYGIGSKKLSNYPILEKIDILEKFESSLEKNKKLQQETCVEAQTHVANINIEDSISNSTPDNSVVKFTSSSQNNLKENFKIEFSDSHKYIRIKNKELSESITLKLFEMDLKTDVNYAMSETLVNERIAWEITDWNVIIALTTDNDFLCIRTNSNEYLFKVSTKNGEH